MAACIDLQVNGYAGVDFNRSDTGADQIRAACDRLRADGVEGILATVITDAVPDLITRIRNIAVARSSDAQVAQMIRGVHIEGPFLNPGAGYIGAHPQEHAVPADLEVMKRLVDAAEGLTRIVTLAPECDDGLRVTAWLADQGITVSAGHCDPSLAQLQAAIDAGLSMVTHLGNGCPLSLHRHDNIIQRALHLSDHLAIGFIADGIHVPFVALANYLRVTGFEKAFVVTDAIAAAGLGPGTYDMLGQAVVVDEQLATWAPDRSHLVGSAMTMPRVRQNLQEHLGLAEDTITRLVRRNPLKAIGLSEEA